ncbi:MAG: chemotaxis protein CheW [Tildeniella nuda ZEHNDER 1965/U140]|jgi:purine-binding chemotaxis protein CheW|nr:chemotaxis protein CheW [Tildeniella nuda ZEHNDER 1965/U140]
MSLQLSPRSQRLRSRKAEFSHQLIVFRLQQEWFALPIQAVQKVIPLGTVYGAGAGAAIGMTLYHDREIPVLNLQQRIFGTASQPLLPDSVPPDRAALQPESRLPQPQRFLLLVETSTGEAIGFPLDAQPMLRRVPASAFVPLSDAYLAEGLRCVKCLIVPAPDQPPFFLLHLDQLLPAQPALPESGHRALPG